MTADITVPEAGVEGMINTAGGRFGGYGFYVVKGKPVFTWNLVDLKRVRWESPEPLTPGNLVPLLSEPVREGVPLFEKRVVRQLDCLLAVCPR